MYNTVQSPTFVNVQGAKESIPPAYVAWRAGSDNQGTLGYIGWRNRFLEIDSLKSIPWLRKHLQIRSLINADQISYFMAI
jgi:hypothetical protein